MSGFIDNTSNIDAAEIAAEYRTPEQGVSAKSNSNVKWNDYRKMTPRANQSANSITTAGSQTLQAQDFGGTAGVVPGATSFSTGSAKGGQTNSVSGVFTAAGFAVINTGSGASNALGNFGLGSSGGTSGLDLSNVASFPSGTTLVGFGHRAVVGGTFFIITSGASAASNWTTCYVRWLYPNGVLTVGGTNYYNPTYTLNRSQFSYDGSTFGSTETWSISFGFGGTLGTSPVSIYPMTIEFA